MGTKTSKEPIIGEWEFKQLVSDGEVTTSDELEELGYKDNAGMYFSCREKEYSLGLPSNTVMKDEGKVDTNEDFTELYAHTYLLDEAGEMRAVFEKEEDLDTL